MNEVIGHSDIESQLYVPGFSMAKFNLPDDDKFSYRWKIIFLYSFYRCN